MTRLAFLFDPKRSMKFGKKSDIALLNAINANAIQSAYENMNASITEPTHHHSPKLHSYPK